MKSRGSSETTNKTKSCYGDLETDTTKLSIPFRSDNKKKDSLTKLKGQEPFF